VTQGCCQPVSQSSTEHWRSCFALTSAAVLWCFITAHLYEEQNVRWHEHLIIYWEAMQSGHKNLVEQSATVSLCAL